MRNVDGLRLFVDTVPSPVVSAHLWFDVGAADEAEGEHGAAHFLEHMLFKGTARRGVGEVAAAIEGMGGDLNAYTSWDETCFFATVEADAWREALDVLFDMTRHSRLDPDEVERERLVILDEVAGYADDPDAVAADTLVAMRYGDHPYARPVLGGAEAVAGLSRDTLHRFWQAHYHPGRAILVISGPVDPDEAEAEVRRLRAGWALGLTRSPLARASDRPAAAVRLLGGRFETTTVQLAWPAPPLGHPDLAAHEVLAAALGQGASSLLPRVLELDAGVATRSWASVDAQREGGMIEIGFQPTDTLEALQAATGILERAWRSGVDGEAVARAREGLLTDQIFDTETVEGRAGEWVQAIAHRGGPEAIEADRRALAAVTSADVRRVARQALAPEHRQVVVVDRRARAAAIEEALAPPPSRPLRAARPAGPEVHHLHGLRVALLPDDGPLAAARVICEGGQWLEPERTPGLARLWAETVTRGAGERPAQAFAERMDALAAWLDGTSGRSSHGLSLSLPADRLELGLELMFDALLDPHFDPVDVGHATEELLEDVESRVDRPEQVASEALWAALWPNHPWRHPVGGTSGSLRRLKAKAVERFHEDTVRQGRLTLAISGGFDPDTVLEQLAELAAELPEPEPLPTVPAPGRPRSPRPQTAGTRQAAVQAGLRLGPDDDAQRRLPLHVAATLLDSQSGRLFLELREARGLAYSVWASADLAPRGGLFTLGLSCAPERVDEGAAGLREAFQRLVDEGPTVDELERAVRLLRGGVAMRRQRVVGRASDLAWATHLDRPYDLPGLRERLDALTPDAIRAALQAVAGAGLEMAVAAPA